MQPPTGNALSAFRALLVEINPMKIFEGLEPLPAVSGEVVWVCKRHALLYR